MQDPSFSAHSPRTASEARVKPRNVLPASPRKIVALRPGRKSYGRKPRLAASSAADAHPRNTWWLW